MKRICMVLTALFLMCALAFGALAEGIVADDDIIAAQAVDQAVEEMADTPLEAEETLPAGEPEAEQVSAVTAADDLIPLDKAHFPNKAFRKSLKKYDKDKDGALSPKEIKAVRQYTASNDAIRDMTGIQYLAYLDTLYIICSNLKTLDLSGNTRLTELNLSNTRLRSLDLSKNTKLARATLDNNKLLKTLITGKNARLTELYCYSNALTKLDVSGLSKLEYLDCSDNKLSKLDVGKLKYLVSLRCEGNNLTKLDVSGCTGLEGLNCWNNQLSALDVSRLGGLKTLGCGGNKISSLDLTKNAKLRVLFCPDNNMTSLKLASKKLFLLVCTGNKIKSIDLAKCPHLIEELRKIPYTPYDNDLAVAWGQQEQDYAEELGDDCFHIDKSTNLLNGKKVLYTDKEPNSIRFSKSSITVKEGTLFNLPAIITDPEGAAITNCEVDYDEKYVSYFYDGFTAQRKGTCTINITTTNGKKAKLKVTVK